MNDNICDLNGRDRNRPLSEMIDMTAYRKRMSPHRAGIARSQNRAEFWSLILAIGHVLFTLALRGTPTASGGRVRRHPPATSLPHRLVLT